MSTLDEKLQENLNRLLGHGAIKGIMFDKFQDTMDDKGNPERITIEFEDGNKVTIRAYSEFDGCGDLDNTVLFIENVQ